MRKRGEEIEGREAEDHDGEEEEDDDDEKVQQVEIRAENGDRMKMKRRSMRMRVMNGPALAGGQNFRPRYSTPKWNTTGNMTTCHITQTVFEASDDDS
ncbi:hypothetical protein B2J93_7962 [Marssonina coronariae]|uniref:Uncharacterized protein n=1 Tax=Diplocarpon coronariae TaxID=2795749 RepID=A0A218ZC89_9HELO|nr:hypothetical protein B2J93_7962 [Marssonina coronariae]